MPRQVGRRIDYTQEEMIQMTGLSRSQFVRGLKRICEMYGFNINDFKVEKDNVNSAFFFTPEVADLLTILLRNLDKHPLKRSNAKMEDIKGTSIAKYNRSILDDIDEETREIVSDAIYCREGHLVAQNISDWTIRFVKQLTFFVINLTTLQHQDVGAALNQFTRKIDEMNYCLFRGDYIKEKVLQSNLEEMKQYEGDNEREDINKKVHLQNISIDHLIAEMIRFYLIDMKNIREEGFKEYELPDMDDDVLRVLVCGDPEDISDFMLRELYYMIEVKHSANIGLLQNNRYIIEHQRLKNNKWKDSIEKIKEGTFEEPFEKRLDERKDILRRNIESCEKELSQYKELLDKLEKQNQEDEKDPFMKEMQEEYVRYCERLEKNYSELFNIVDRFVGRAIYELLI